jgi:ribonuclease HI
MSDEVIIYSDGGADPNPGMGGWAAIVRFADGEERVLSGSDPETTNNRMEVTAAIAALESLPRPSRVALHTDSQYLRRGITEWLPAWVAAGWRTKAGRPVANVDLWQKLAALATRHDIVWHWVRGHSGNPANERVDRLAREARLALAPELEDASDVTALYLRAACRGNPGPGAWAVALHDGDEWHTNSGIAASTTNNRMELTAAIEGLALLPSGSRAQLVTTSDYLYQGITRWVAGWQARGWIKADGQPVANADLWRRLHDMVARYQVEWVNAKGQRLEGLARADDALRHRPEASAKPDASER